MAPGLIVPGVVRYSVNGLYAAVPVTNVLDMHIDSAFGLTRDTNVIDQAHIIVSNWADLICPFLSDRYSALECSWVDMNNSSGTTGVVTTGTGSDFPQVGGDGSPAMPGNNAYLIRKAIVSSRGARQGRMFLPGVGEAATNTTAPNTVTSATRAVIDAAMGDFLSGINQSGTYNSDLVVVHTTNTGTPQDPVIEFVSRSHVNSLTCDSSVHSQRRRLGF